MARKRGPARATFRYKQDLTQDTIAVQLRQVRDELADLERKRAELVASRDRLVNQGRQLGVSWDRLAASVGVTRAALIQRRTGTRTQLPH